MTSGTEPLRSGPDGAKPSGPEVADPIIRRLFSIALTLSSARSLVSGPAAERLELALERLDELAHDLRSGILEGDRAVEPEISGWIDPRVSSRPG